MAGKTTIALTADQYDELIATVRSGGVGFRPNDRIATALVIEANLGIRIGDVVKLKLKDIIYDAGRYRLDIVEEKTKKKRTFKVPLPVYQYLQIYALRNEKTEDDILIDITVRQIQKHLQKVVDYLDYGNSIGTHSFRKFFATDIFKASNYNIRLVQDIMQHSSVSITQRYIGISDQMIEDALDNHTRLA